MHRDAYLTVRDFGAAVALFKTSSKQSEPGLKAATIFSLFGLKPRLLRVAISIVV